MEGAIVVVLREPLRIETPGELERSAKLAKQLR